jgi:hypothetical protein
MLMQITEEETHTLPGGDSYVVRSTSDPDAYGKLRVVQRQIEETKKISKDVEDTKTTVMLPSVNGGLAPAMKVEELRTLGANNKVESQKTTLLPDGAGNWQVDEIWQATTRQEGKNRRTDERVSRPDSDSQRTNSTGQQTTEQQVEQPNLGDPGSGLQVITLTTDTVRPSSGGAQATRTIQVRDANGSFGVASVDTTRSDNIYAIQVQIAPSENPK